MSFRGAEGNVPKVSTPRRLLEISAGHRSRRRNIPGMGSRPNLGKRLPIKSWGNAKGEDKESSGEKGRTGKLVEKREYPEARERECLADKRK